MDTNTNPEQTINQIIDESETQPELNHKEKREYEKAMKKYQKMRNQWKKEDLKLKPKIIDAITSLLTTTGIESYEDEECTQPTTKETLNQKTIEELTQDFDDILLAINAKVNQPK